MAKGKFESPPWQIIPPKGKFESPPRMADPVKRSKVKMVAIILTIVLTLCGIVGGTVAWLTDEAEPVVNTFTYGDIEIDLGETDTELDDDDDPNTNDYEMLPGQTIIKDPVVTVKAGSEELWLFVKLEKSENFDTFMEFEMAEGWTELTGVEGVYYRHITAEEVAKEDQEFHVIADDIIKVKESVTKEMLNDLDKDPQNPTYPTLTITAYAVQYAGNPTVEEAWAKVETQAPTP